MASVRAQTASTDIQVILLHHHRNPRGHRGDHVRQSPERHRLRMRFPVVLAARYTLQGPARELALSFQFLKNHGGQFHVVSPSYQVECLGIDCLDRTFGQTNAMMRRDCLAAKYDSDVAHTITSSI